MKLRTFQIRLLLWSFGLLLVALGLLLFSIMRTVSDDLLAETRERAERQLKTIIWLAGEHREFESEQQLDRWVKGLGKRLDTRITFIHLGRVVADSMVPYEDVASLSNHATRPEVMAAFKQSVAFAQRRSDTLDREMLYAASRAPNIALLVEGVLRVAVPMTHVRDRLADLRFNFLTIFLVIMGVAALLIVMLSRGVSKSIRDFADLALAIGRGDYRRRIYPLPGDEFSRLADAVNAMAKSIGDNVATIEAQRGQLQAMFEGMEEGILILDASGRIEAWNRAMTKMHPPVPQSVGRTPLEAFMSLTIQNAVDKTLADPSRRRTSALAEMSDGRQLELNVVPYSGHDGKPRLVLVFHDVTKARKSERSLRDFVANVSHQLRTPLTSIQGYAETLLANPPKDMSKAEKFLKTINKNARHMSEVLSSLLVLAKSARPQKNQVLEADATEVARRAMDDLLPRAETRNMKLKSDLPEGPLLVAADEESLLTVLHNLLDNAIKYGSEGQSVTVTGKKTGDTVIFEVCDRGEGVPIRYRDRIFERFYRVDDNTIAADGSAGIGLAVCRQIMDNLDGEISCHPLNETRQTGTCFRFTLPAVKPK